MKENKVTGQVVYVKETFDSYACELSAGSVSTRPDKSLREYEDGLGSVSQDRYVINCFSDIDDESFTNEFVQPRKNIKQGDPVYVLIVDDSDPYGQVIAGVFTEEPDAELVKKYSIHEAKGFARSIGEFDENKDYSVCENDYALTRIVKLTLS